MSDGRPCLRDLGMEISDGIKPFSLTRMVWEASDEACRQRHPLGGHGEG